MKIREMIFWTHMKLPLKRGIMKGAAISIYLTFLLLLIWTSSIHAIPDDFLKKAGNLLSKCRERLPEMDCVFPKK